MVFKSPQTVKTFLNLLNMFASENELKASEQNTWGFELKKSLPDQLFKSVRWTKHPSFHFTVENLMRCLSLKIDLAIDPNAYRRIDKESDSWPFLSQPQKSFPHFWREQLNQMPRLIASSWIIRIVNSWEFGGCFVPGWDIFV